jgi:hypothetical protein
VHDESQWCDPFQVAQSHQKAAAATIGRDPCMQQGFVLAGAKSGIMILLSHVTLRQSHQQTTNSTAQR